LPSCGSISRLFVKDGTEYKVRIEPQKGFEQDFVTRTVAITKNKIKAIGLSGDAFGDPDDQSAMIVKVYGAVDAERIETFLFTSHQLELRKAISSPNPMPLTSYTSIDEATPAMTTDQEIVPYGDEGGLPRFVIVEKKAVINGNDIRDAHAVSRSGSQNEYQITFSLKPDAAVRFGDWTGRNINNYIAVMLDKRVQSAAYIKTQIFDSAEITGRFSKQVAEDIALSLSSGFLPVTMTVVERRKIGN
jgi:protein-export membrane protein SecD